MESRNLGIKSGKKNENATNNSEVLALFWNQAEEMPKCVSWFPKIAMRRVLATLGHLRIGPLSYLFDPLIVRPELA